MQIPDRIRITREISYRVILVTSFEDTEIVGLCDQDSRTIYLKKGEPDIFATLLHETLHAITFEYKKVRLSHKQIYALEGPLAVILKLNRLGRRH